MASSPAIQPCSDEPTPEEVGVFCQAIAAYIRNNLGVTGDIVEEDDDDDSES